MLEELFSSLCVEATLLIKKTFSCYEALVSSSELGEVVFVGFRESRELLRSNA